MLKLRLIIVSLMLVAQIASAQTTQPQSNESFLPAGGIPEGSVVVRLNLANLAAADLSASVDAIAQVLPQDDPQVQKQSASIRKDILPIIIDARNSLVEAGAKDLLLVAEVAETSTTSQPSTTTQAASKTSAYLLLRAPGLEPAKAEALLEDIAKKSITSFEKYDQELKATTQPLAMTLPADAFEQARQACNFQVVRWDESWLLVRVTKEQKDQPMPAAQKIGREDFEAALARDSQKPLCIVYRLSDEARAQMVQGAASNPFFGGLAMSASQMQWASWSLTFGTKPQLDAVVHFGQPEQASAFGAQISQLLMFVSAMASHQPASAPANDSSKAIAALLADLMPVSNGQDVVFTLTADTVAKITAVQKADTFKVNVKVNATCDGK